MNKLLPYLFIVLLSLAMTGQGQISSSATKRFVRYVDDAAAGTCNAAREGFVYHNITTNAPRFCNGTAWSNFVAGGGGGGDALVANPLSQFASTTSAQFAGVISNETGTGVVVLATSPTLVTPNLGTPSSLTCTNCSGTAASLTAGNVTTNANLSGVVVSSGSNVTTPGKTDVMQTSGYAADAGSNDTYVATYSPAITAYVAGTLYRFKANTANTGAATININSIGALTIKKVQGAITTDLADNDIRANQVVTCIYDGTNCQMTSQLGNAPSASVTGTDTQVTFFDGANNPAGDAGMTYNKTTDTLTVGSIATAGSVAAAIQLTEGTTPTAAAANSVKLQAPTDVTTAYDLILPAASATGFFKGTNSSNVNTMSFVVPGSGVETWFVTPSIANLFSAVTGEGTGVATALAANTNATDGIVTPNGTATLSAKTITNPAITAQTLTDGATVNWDANSGGIASVTLGGNRTMAAPTNLKTGGSYALRVIQDGTGSRTMTWNSVFKWPAATAPTLSTTAARVDLITCISFDGTNLLCSSVLDVR